MVSTHSKFTQNLKWQYVLQLLKYILPLATLPYLTRVLSPSSYAVVAYVAALMAYVQVIVEFGFNLSGTKRIAEASSEHEGCRILSEITLARLLISLIAFLGIALIALRTEITRENLAFTFLSFVATCGRASTPDFIFQGKEVMKPLTTRYFITKGTSTILTFVLIDSPSDLLWVPVLDILSSIISVAWSFSIAQKMFSFHLVFPSLSGTLKEVSVSALYCFSNVAATTLSTFITLMIGVTVADKRQIAYWSLALTAITAIQALYGPIMNSLYPHIVVTRNYGFVWRIALYSFFPVLLVSCLFALLSGTIYAVLGGADYIEGAYVGRLLAPLLFFSYYAMLLGWPLLGAAGRVPALTGSTVGAAVLCVLAFFALIATRHTSVAAFCVVRVLVEAALFLSRGFFSRDFLRSQPS